MNLVYGGVIAILNEDGVRMGKVRIGGALRKVPIELLAAVKCGDTVLVCDGVAISRVDRDVESTNHHVSRDPRQADRDRPY